MPTYEIRTPDGHVYEVTADTPEAANQTLMDALAKQPAAASQSPLEGVLDSFTEGLTFGYGDKITATEAALLGKTPDGGWFDYTRPYGERYDAALAAETAQNEAFAEDSPTLAAGSEIAGNIGTALVPFANVGRLYQGTGLGARALNSALVGGATGAAGGGIQGSSEGDGFGERLDNAVSGTFMGAAFGAVGGPILDGIISTVARGLGNVAGLSGTRAKERAAQMVREAMDADGISPDDLATTMAGRSDQLTLADLGPNLRELVGASARMGGRAAKTADEFLTGRQVGQFGRMEDDVAALAGRPADDFYAAGDAIDEARRAVGARYGDIYAQPPVNISDDALSVLMTPDGEKAVRAATRQLDNMRAPGLMTQDGRFTVRGLDQVQRALRDRVEKARRAGKGEEATVLGRLRDDLLDALPADLRGAMKDYRGEVALREALEEGRKFMRGDAEAAGRRISSMTREEVEAYRLGAARALVEKMGDKVSTADRSAMLRTPNMERAVREVFGDNVTADKFLERVADEQSMNQTFNEVLRGSQTAKRSQASENFAANAAGDFLIETAATGGTTGGMLSGAAHLARAGVNRIGRGINQNVAGEVADLALKPGGAIPQAVVPRGLQGIGAGPYGAALGASVGRLGEDGGGGAAMAAPAASPAFSAEDVAFPDGAGLPDYGSMVAPETVSSIIRAESGGDPTEKNPNSSASGVGQFIDSTWINTVRKHRPDLANLSRSKLLALKSDPALGAEMTAAYARDNANYLADRGIVPDAGNIYLAHFAGPGGAAKLHQASPGTNAGKVLGAAAVKANPFLAKMSAADVIYWAARKVA